MSRMMYRKTRTSNCNTTILFLVAETFPRQVRGLVDKLHY